MMRRLVGALFLITAAIIMALALVKKEKKRIDQVRRFLELLKYIGRNIEAFDLPIGEIVKRADPKLISDCVITEEGRFAPIDELYLGEKEKEAVFGFFSELGRSYREEQIKLCGYYSASLEAALAGLLEEYPKKRRLALTLSICISLGIIILLL